MKRNKIYYNPTLKPLARKLRNDSTKSEIILWGYLKGKQIRGYDFHRQKPIDNYIVDFFCFKLMLAIELDGISHGSEEQFIRDNQKDICLNRLGINILRFDDEEVYYQMDNVLSTIEYYIEEYEETHSRYRSI